MEDGASIFCARCRGYGDFVFLPESLETMCSECGLFLECHVSIEISEGRTLDNIELCRVGSPYSPRDEVLYTAISKNPDGKKRKFGWVGNQGSITDCNLIEAFETIITMADRLHLDAAVKSGACGLYKKLYDHQSVKGRTRDAIIASCLYIACQQESLPRTVQEICVVGERATEEEIDREKEFVTKRLITIQAINLLRRFCCSLGMSEQAIKAAEEAAKKCEKLAIRSRSPVTIAAGLIGIIYMIAQLSKEELLLEDISDATGIAGYTILDSFEVLNPHAPKIIPPSYSDKDGLTCLRKPLKFEEMSTNNMVRGVLIPTRLPNDIINEIVMRLPAISNFRFKCVSKQWFSLNFEALKLKSQTHTAFGIFYGTFKGVRDARAKYVKTEKDQNDDSCIDGTLSFLPEHRRMLILDSCNGLLLCECNTGKFQTSHLYVTNPALRKWVNIPNISMVTVRDAFLDFNPLVSVHFKVIIIMGDFHVSRNLKVFSSETGEWSESHVTESTFLAPRLFYDGLIFVMDGREISGFDLEGKWCSRTEYPGMPYLKKGDFEEALYQSGGCLHYYCYGSSSISEDCEVYVWKLESGSWLFKSCFSVPFPRIYIESIKFHPIKDDIIFLQINDRLYSYNIKTTQAIKLCSFTLALNYCLYSPFYLDFSGYWWKKMNG